MRYTKLSVPFMIDLPRGINPKTTSQQGNDDIDYQDSWIIVSGKCPRPSAKSSSVHSVNISSQQITQRVIRLAYDIRTSPGCLKRLIATSRLASLRRNATYKVVRQAQRNKCNLIGLCSNPIRFDLAMPCEYREQPKQEGDTDNEGLEDRIPDELQGR